MKEPFTLDVKTALKSFAGKGPGAAGISNTYLTNAPDNIKQVLTIVYNVALVLG